MSRPVRIEKRKWDGRVSAVDPQAVLVPTEPPALAWFVAAGSVRERPLHGETEVVGVDELWLTLPGEWWVLCAEADEDAVVSLILHAAVPVDLGPELLLWIDLDLDLEVHDGEVSLKDEEQFHQHASTMDYPAEVVRGAWAGISRMAPRYTIGEWPFDGWLERTLGEVRGGAPPRPMAQRRSPQAGDADPPAGS